MKKKYFKPTLHLLLKKSKICLGSLKEESEFLLLLIIINHYKQKEENAENAQEATKRFVAPIGRRPRVVTNTVT